MTKRRINKTSFAAVADREAISPSSRPPKAVVQSADDRDDPVTRAEAALAQLGDEFANWMAAECRRLDAARHIARTSGFNETSYRELFRAAHDIKGEAATFGFPAIAPFAESLCRLLEQTPDRRHIPVVLIDRHVDAICAARREHGRSGYDAVTAALIEQLRDATNGFLSNAVSLQPDAPDPIVHSPKVK